MLVKDELNDSNSVSKLTKTKAKKILFISFDNENKNVLNEIKKYFIYKIKLIKILIHFLIKIIKRF